MLKPGDRIRSTYRKTEGRIGTVICKHPNITDCYQIQFDGAFDLLDYGNMYLEKILEIPKMMTETSDLKKTVQEINEAIREFLPSTRTILTLIIVDHFFLGGRIRKALIERVEKLLAKTNE